MIPRVKLHPVPVVSLLSALIGDQQSCPHRFPTNHPLSTVMLAAARFDGSERTRAEYEAISASITRWARLRMRHDASCDECMTLMGEGTPAHEWGELDFRHVFNAKFASYFLCSNCAESWLCEGDAGLPRITGLTTRHLHVERWAQEGKDKLSPLPLSGPLFAGLVIPGGSEPIALPFRGDDWALSNIPRILNTFRFDLTEAA